MVKSVLVLVALLVVSACGARLTDEQMEAATVHQPGPSAIAGGADPGPMEVGGRTTTTSARAEVGGGSLPPGAGAPPVGGAALGSPDAVGPGSSGACSPQPVEEVGVSNTEIRLGNVSTITGPIAGFGATGVNGVRAYLAYVNGLGGVCGRQLTLATADDRLDAGQNRASAAALVDEVFGFVGGTSVVDSGVAAVLEGTDAVSTALAISDPAIASPNMFSPLPIDPSGTTQGTRGMWEYFRATRGVTKVAVVYPAQADARARALAYLPDIQGAGLTVAGPFEVAITETNYVGVAQQIENSGADAVLTALESTGMSRLAQAFHQIDFAPKVPFYGSQAYGQLFLQLAGDAAEGTTLGIAHAIFEDAATTPAVATFNDWYARTAPGSAPDFMAIMGWTAADMMVQALEAAGPAPTRAAVLEFLQGLHDFDAHGFLAPNDPAGKHAAADFMVVTVRDGRWVREYPIGAGFGSGA